MPKRRFLLLAAALFAAGCAGHMSSSQELVTARRPMVPYSSHAQEIASSFSAHVQQIESTLPVGTKIYVVHNISVYDPLLRTSESFPADSLVTKNESETVVTPPNRGAVVFSPHAIVTQDSNDVEYVFVRPGQQTPQFLQEHAKLEKIK